MAEQPSKLYNNPFFDPDERITKEQIRAEEKLQMKSYMREVADELTDKQRAALDKTVRTIAADLPDRSQVPKGRDHDDRER